MSSSAGGDRDTILAALDMIEAGHDMLAAESFDVLTHPELVAVLGRLETQACKQPAIAHRLIARLAAEADPKALGGTSLADVLATRLRISTGEARRRIKYADLLGPRRAMTGEELPPKLPAVAATLERGQVGPEHLRVIERFFDELPHSVDYATREHAEAQLAEIACGLGPAELRQAADRLMALLNQDGDLPDDADRARRRFLSVSKQGVDGMSEITGLLDPEARATVDAVLAKWAAPGMCNPDDDAPCVDGDAGAAAVQGDARSQGQRNHDALTAMGRSVLACGQLGKHNGLPATIIVSTTLQELQSGQGCAVTGGGSLLPMRDVIRLASHSHHYLVIFDQHTQVPLYLGRSKRLASAGQRIVLLAKDRGCTRPGCTVPGYWCQVHHAVNDWADGGQSNIDEETLACGPDNRLVEDGGWTTRKRKDGRTEWIPPPHLDTGQTRVNDYHHPQNYLLPEDDEDEPTAD
jgi:hypothetical protein